MEEITCPEIQKQVQHSKKMLFEKDRLETFNEHWKDLKGFKFCSPKNFAEAGFYNSSSVKFPDNVKCFACFKELSDWEKNDDPWQEHVKRGSKCPFVIFKKKTNPTVEDFLILLFDIRKIILNQYFEKQIEGIKHKEKVLLKYITDIQKSKK